MIKRCVLLIFSILLCGVVHAQEKKKERLKDKIFGKNLRFIGNPIIQNSPETGIKVGLAGNYLFKTGRRCSTLFKAFSLSDHDDIPLDGLTH